MSGKSLKVKLAVEAYLEIADDLDITAVAEDLDVMVGYDGLAATVVDQTYKVVGIEEEYDDDWAIPQELNLWGVTGALEIRKFLNKEGALFTGGCKVFYHPDEWKERGEEYGLDADLIICHDGGAHAPYFNMDYEQYEKHNRMTGHLSEFGLWTEQATCWYTALYHKED